MKVGFTGTRVGMTVMQRASLLQLLREYGADMEFHHGDCVGADAQAHELAKLVGCRVVIHPPTNDKLRAYCKGDKTLGRKTYIARNKDLVMDCNVLIATPRTAHEEQRSGTWATVRFARRTFTVVYIIYPHGAVVRSKP